MHSKESSTERLVYPTNWILHEAKIGRPVGDYLSEKVWPVWREGLWLAKTHVFQLGDYGTESFGPLQGRIYSWGPFFWIGLPHPVVSQEDWSLSMVKETHRDFFGDTLWYFSKNLGCCYPLHILWKLKRHITPRIVTLDFPWFLNRNQMNIFSDFSKDLSEIAACSMDAYNILGRDIARGVTSRDFEIMLKHLAGYSLLLDFLIILAAFCIPFPASDMIDENRFSFRDVSRRTDERLQVLGDVVGRMTKGQEFFEAFRDALWPSGEIPPFAAMNPEGLWRGVFSRFMGRMLPWSWSFSPGYDEKGFLAYDVSIPVAGRTSREEVWMLAEKMKLIQSLQKWISDRLKELQ